MSRYAGFGTLLRLAWRRDRVLILTSALALIALAYGSAKATVDLYPNPQDATGALAAVFDNPAVVALYGPLPARSLDALATFKPLLMGAVLLALLGFAIVRRHTRAEEEDGRYELLGAGAVGRYAPLAAAVSLGALAVVGTATLSGLSLMAVGLDPRGSIAFGVAWASVGVAQVGITAIAAQIASTARGVAALANGLLGAFFLVRMGADLAGRPALLWLSPLGWVEQTGPYGANRLWVLLLGAVTLTLCVAIAFELLDRRDLGAGLLPARRGPSSGRLGSVAALVARLLRPSTLGWLLTYAVLGAVVGALVGSVGDIAKDPAVRAMLEKLSGSAGSLEDIYLSTQLLFLAAGAAAAGISVAGWLGSEERSGRGEAMLALPVSRTRWYAVHALFAIGMAALLMAVLGVVLGIVSAPHLGLTSGAAVATLVAAALSTLPAAAVAVGFALLCFGASPRLGWAAWGVFAVTFLLGEFGPLMSLPEWLIGLSPFTHLSHLPGGRLDVAPTVAMTAIAGLLTLAGWAIYRHRDLA